MEKLSEDDHNILYALYFQNTPVQYLSRKLGIPRSTVQYREKKALNNLREIIRKK